MTLTEKTEGGGGVGYLVLRALVVSQVQTEVTQTDGLYWKRDLFDEQGNESGYDGRGYVCMGAERGGRRGTTTDARWAGEVGKEKRGLAGGIGFLL